MRDLHDKWNDWSEEMLEKKQKVKEGRFIRCQICKEKLVEDEFPEKGKHEKVCLDCKELEDYSYSRIKIR